MGAFENSVKASQEVNIDASSYQLITANKATIDPPFTQLIGAL
ncbi:hypothetical protein PRUB_a3834 [Pseudoalteromonas rubra]|uniref:Uncharacterized protein n=1 Tax=Pseudoalteromonas rubra TaxID=43658 RepID=A0A8T0C892_9GAMM|nr:hypothetical protein PRUB_a3834 [Pseudoalteromonas rubra]